MHPNVSFCHIQTGIKMIISNLDRKKIYIYIYLIHFEFIHSHNHSETDITSRPQVVVTAAWNMDLLCLWYCLVWWIFLQSDVQKDASAFFFFHCVLNTPYMCLCYYRSSKRRWCHDTQFSLIAFKSKCGQSVLKVKFEKQIGFARSQRTFV